MNPARGKPDKELYRQLRALPWDQLWTREAARFNTATPQQRNERVAVIRAVGVVFAESGRAEQKSQVRQWLLDLLQDPCEKARRYAMAALPKIGADPGDEAKLIRLLQSTSLPREKKFVGLALEKIGGAETLAVVLDGNADFLAQAREKVKARLARGQNPSAINPDGALVDFAGVRIHLRGRKGLETMVRDEVEESARHGGKFSVLETASGLVAITATAPFSLADIYTFRCFGSVGFVLGNVPFVRGIENIEGMAALISSALSRRILRTFTQGAIRYRLNYVDKGHQRGAVRRLAARIYALCPEILNDAREVTWTADIHPVPEGNSVELRPNITPDPRFYYRKGDVPAASHPPLAAALARFAGRVENEIVWDPFCGSGLELIESALLGGVHKIYATDRDAAALAVARTNFAAAGIKTVPINFSRADFRDFARAGGLSPNGVTLVITNPPMGKRVSVGDLRRLMEDLFNVAAQALKPGGRLVLMNPLLLHTPHPFFQLQSRHPVDFGGFECQMERYLKLSA